MSFVPCEVLITVRHEDGEVSETILLKRNSWHHAAGQWWGSVEFEDGTVVNLVQDEHPEDE